MNCNHPNGIEKNISDIAFKMMLKRVFELYMEENISDERVQRVVEPIITVIGEGRFDKTDDSTELYIEESISDEQEKLCS